MNFRALFEDLYHITIYDDNEQHHYELKYLKRITQHELKGTLTTGERIHLKRTKPFDFVVKQIY